MAVAFAHGDREIIETPGRPARAVAAADPAQTALRYAQIATDWGVCGAVWKLHACAWPQPGKGGAEPAFAEPPVDALLCRIIGPGLAPPQLCTQLRACAPWGLEVLPTPQGQFASQVVPDWYGELVGFLRTYFSTCLHPSVQDEQVDQWDFWKPRLDMSGLTDFQRRVLEHVARIPRGQVRTYGELARELGMPNAARAVGGVMRTNPWPILIPCHRVVGAGGALTGYSGPGSVCAKQRLLELEHGSVRAGGRA
jgi:O-6-methylguanine DNA methyltransferase